MESHQCDNETKWNERMLFEDLLYSQGESGGSGEGLCGEQVGVARWRAWRAGGRGEKVGVARWRAGGAGGRGLPRDCWVTSVGSCC